MIIEHGRNIYWEIHKARKGMWASFFIVLFGRWLAEPTPITWLFPTCLESNRLRNQEFSDRSELGLKKHAVWNSANTLLNTSALRTIMT